MASASVSNFPSPREHVMPPPVNVLLGDTALHPASTRRMEIAAIVLSSMVADWAKAASLHTSDKEVVWAIPAAYVQ